MERSKFWAFAFSFMPGAGEMYLGLKRKGTEIMLLFLGIFFLSMFFNLGAFMVFSAVIWFYSFFDTMDLSRMKHEDRIKLEDKFLINSGDNLEISYESIKSFVLKRKKFVGAACVLIGLYIILDAVVMPIVGSFLDMLNIDSYFYWNIINGLPTVFLAVLVIYFGLKLVSYNIYNEPKDTEDEIIEFKDNSPVTEEAEPQSNLTHDESSSNIK